MDDVLFVRLSPLCCGFSLASFVVFFFFFSSRRRHTRCLSDWSSDVCSSDLALTPGTSILKAAHAAGVDVTATCGGRGRCTSCRVKFVAGTVPPPTIGDEVQLGDALVREGYRLACQCVPIEAVTVELAPPLEERSFQILGRGPGLASGLANGRGG